MPSIELTLHHLHEREINDGECRQCEQELNRRRDEAEPCSPSEQSLHLSDARLRLSTPIALRRILAPRRRRSLRPRASRPSARRTAPFVMPSSRCKQCDRPLVEIDNYGERLVGCIECNRWTWRGSKTLIELPEADLEALKAVNKEKLC
jgi:hypothetical protein